MSLNEALLARLNDWKPGGRQTLTVTDQDTDWAVLLTADRSDALGCLVWELTLRRSNPPAGDVPALRAWADRVARRATGLLETLKVIEVDEPRQLAMLRSQQPAERGDELFYYEVLLRGTAEASVRRYQASRQPDKHREQVTFALTHEAVAKLALDLTADG